MTLNDYLPITKSIHLGLSTLSNNNTTSKTHSYIEVEGTNTSMANPHEEIFVPHCLPNGP